MARDFDDKSAARQWVWDTLSAEGVARFPFPPHGRIPNFAGAELAAARLFDIEPWKSATAIKVNPDSPQRPIRAEALRRGIIVFVPTPRLRGGFKKLDPHRIPPDKITQAASLSHGDRWSEEIPLADMPRLDAIVCGSVAVTPGGRRCGKGEGYSDLEFAILRELGHPPVPVATTVHDLQIVDSLPLDPTDLPLRVITTPTQTIRVRRPSAAPRGIDWTRLSADDLEEMPILAELKRMTLGVRASRAYMLGFKPGWSCRPSALTITNAAMSRFSPVPGSTSQVYWPSSIRRSLRHFVRCRRRALISTASCAVCGWTASPRSR